jgi:uncharacterized repeat protein (TIGR03803 family)
MWNDGSLRAVTTDGTDFPNFYSFTPMLPDFGGTNSDGGFPDSTLVSSGDTLYGTTPLGGAEREGTIFAINTDGTHFTNLHNFSAPSGTLETNSDGAAPQGGLVLSGDTLYGTTESGGSFGNGVVFAISTDGNEFTNLHNFTTTSGPLATNCDGIEPQGGLVLSGGTLCGTAERGGNFGNGVVFAINTDGTDFTNLHDFSATSGPNETNSDGQFPNGGLILSGNTLYGTAFYGGNSGGNGTVFKLNTDKTGFAPCIAFRRVHTPLQAPLPTAMEVFRMPE